MQPTRKLRPALALLASAVTGALLSAALLGDPEPSFPAALGGPVAPGWPAPDPQASAWLLQSLGYASTTSAPTPDRFWSSGFAAGNAAPDLSEGYVAVPGGGFVTHGF